MLATFNDLKNYSHIARSIAESQFDATALASANALSSIKDGGAGMLETAKSFFTTVKINGQGILETAQNFVTVFFEEAGRVLASFATGIKEKSTNLAIGIKDKFMSLLNRERPSPPGNNSEPSPVIAFKDVEQKVPDIILQKPASMIPAEKPPQAATLPENLTGSGLTIAGSAPKPTLIQRTVERVISGISAEDLDQKLNKQEENFFAKIEGLKNQIASMGSQNFQAIALSNKIDQLTGTKLYNITVSGMSGLTDADIPNDITASNYLPLAGGTLTGALTVTSLTLSGDFTISGAQTLSGLLTIPYFSATSTTNASIITYRLGIGTTSPFAKLSVAGSGFFNDALTASNITATGTLSALGLSTLTGGFISNASSSIGAGLQVAGAFNASSTSFFNGLATFGNASTSVLTISGTASTTNLIVSNTSAFYGKVGIGTTTPYALLSLSGSTGAQFSIAQANTNYTEFTVDASGNLSINPSGSTVTVPNGNFKICSGGDCQTTALLSGYGNLTVENGIEIGGSYIRTCATGYIWVPGSAKFGTLPGFCVMKYEAKNDGSNNAVSTAAGGPYVSIDQPTSRSKCEAVGLGYHLISESEWMTIAEDIAKTPINDLDTDAGLQLATGHSDNAPTSALAATTGADPVVSGCNWSADMENAANAYAAASCEIRGNGAGGSTDADKGYYGTGQTWSATGYSAGVASKSQLRTHILSNGNVIWDIAGNVWEWTDAFVNGTAEKPTPVTDAWAEYTAVTSFVILNYARPQNPAWTSANGIGKYIGGSVAGQHGFLRGGVWSDGVVGGVFSLTLGNALSDVYTSIGFRCAR